MPKYVNVKGVDVTHEELRAALKQTGHYKPAINEQFHYDALFFNELTTSTYLRVEVHRFLDTASRERHNADLYAVNLNTGELVYFPKSAAYRPVLKSKKYEKPPFQPLIVVEPKKPLDKKRKKR